MSSEPPECPEPAATSDSMMPTRTSLACSSSSARRCGERESIPAEYPLTPEESSQEGPRFLVPCVILSLSKDEPGPQSSPTHRGTAPGVRASERGFSLIEVLIATALFAVVAFGAFELVRQLGENARRLTARHVAYGSLERLAAQLRAEARSATAICARRSPPARSRLTCWPGIATGIWMRTTRRSSPRAFLRPRRSHSACSTRAAHRSAAETRWSSYGSKQATARASPICCPACSRAGSPRF